MRSIKEILHAELVAGRTMFDWMFLLLGILVQVVVFVLQPDNPIAIVSGIAGIISVILCAQGKISTFFFGFIQISTYLYLCVVQKLYSGVAINVFYLCSQFYAIFVWSKHYRLHTDSNSVSADQSSGLVPRQLSWKMMLVFTVACLLLSALTGWLLSVYTDDTQPWLDAFTTVPAIFAQVLMMLAYRDQWVIWLFIDVLSIIMWARAGNWCMVAQYAFWCANCIYGWHHWHPKDA